MSIRQFRRGAVLALALLGLRGGTLAAQAEQAGAGPVAMSMDYARLEQFLTMMVPPEAQQDVRNIHLSAEGDQLRVEAEVRLGRLPGLQLLGGLAWQTLAATGPVLVPQPGMIGWEIRTVTLSGFAVPQNLWLPYLQQMTRRPDAIVPFPAATWVKRVVVDSTQLLVY